MTEDSAQNQEVITCNDCPLPLETIVVGMSGIMLARRRDATGPLLDAVAEALSQNSEVSMSPYDTSDRLRAIRKDLFDNAALLGGAAMQFDDEVIGQFVRIASSPEFCDQVGRETSESGCPKLDSLLYLLSRFTPDTP